MELDLSAVLAQLEASGTQCRKLSKQFAVFIEALRLLQQNMQGAYGDLVQMAAKQLGLDPTDVPELHRSKGDSLAVIRALKETATPILKLDIELADNGSSEVSIDDGPQFHLAPKLTLLLRLISSNQCHVPDGLPVFRSVAAMKRTTSEFARSRLTQLIHRLRKKFRENGVNPYLIETDRRPDGLFVRFRRRKAAHFRPAQRADHEPPERAAAADAGEGSA